MAAAGRQQGKEELDEELSGRLENLELERNEVEEQEEEEEEEEEAVVPVLDLQAARQYAVDVTLDPGTANLKLTLSDDGKSVQKRPTDNPHRFNHSLNVLSEEGFSEGRFYFEVQVEKKTRWTIGVARESISRDGAVTVAPSHGIWAIRMKNKNQFEACARPSVPLSLNPPPKKVGVFVDQEKHLVTFYNAVNGAVIYSFTDCDFTKKKLYPFFSPGPDDRGRNSSPLVITPVTE